MRIWHNLKGYFWAVNQSRPRHEQCDWQVIGNLPNVDTEIRLLHYSMKFGLQKYKKKKKSNWANKDIVDQTPGHNTKMVSVIFFFSYLHWWMIKWTTIIYGTIAFKAKKGKSSFAFNNLIGASCLVLEKLTKTMLLVLFSQEVLLFSRMRCIIIFVKKKNVLYHNRIFSICFEKCSWTSEDRISIRLPFLMHCKHNQM